MNFFKFLGTFVEEEIQTMQVPVNTILWGLGGDLVAFFLGMLPESIFEMAHRISYWIQNTRERT